MDDKAQSELQSDQERHDREAVAREYDEYESESDIDELRDNQQVRLGLYHALRETRGEPGLTLERVASVIMTALSREEVQALVKELNKNLDA